MTDTVKLLIELPKKTVEHIRSGYGHGCKDLYFEDRSIIAEAVYNATQFDDVKKEIHKKSVWIHGFNYVDICKIDEIFDSIENGEEE